MFLCTVSSRAILTGALSIFLLSACAQLPSGQPEPVAAAPADPSAPEKGESPKPAPSPHAAAPEQAEAPEQDQASTLPDQELTGQILYQMLLAEIAAQRGSMQLAVSAYIELAKSTRDPRIARRAAEIGHFARQPEAALEAARLWVELEPRSVLARQMTIALLASVGRYQEISEHVGLLLEREKTGLPDALLRLNRMFGRIADRQAIQQLINTITEPYLQHPEAHFVRAQTAATANDAASALKEVEQALAMRPAWEPAAILKAQILARDAPAEAIHALESFLASNPGAKDARLQYARLLSSERRYEQARAEFQSLLSGFPDNADVMFAVGVLSLQLQDYDVAEKHFRTLLQREFREPNTLRVYLGQIAEQQKRLPEALEWYSSVGSGDQFLPAQIRLASVLGRQGRLEQAREHLRSVSASSNRERVQLLLAEAQLLREAGQTRDAFEFLDAQLETQPNQPEILYESALLAERIGKNDVLESYLRKLIQIKPDHAHAYNALGYSLADRNERIDEAHQLIAKALEYSPDDPFILDSMGWVLYRKGDLAGARKYLERAYGMRPDPEIAAHLGEVLWMQGERDGATRTWREAQKTHPDNDVLSKAIRKFLP